MFATLTSCEGIIDDVPYKSCDKSRKSLMSSALTINKGQPLKTSGLNLQLDFFSQGQQSMLSGYELDLSIILKGYSVCHDQVALDIRQRCWPWVLNIDEPEKHMTWLFRDHSWLARIGQFAYTCSLLHIVFLLLFWRMLHYHLVAIYLHIIRSI